jgi:hypothetical protein
MFSLQSQQSVERRTIERLATDAHLPLDEVAKLYEHERAALVASAHVTNFLPIFVVRNVQEILRHKGHREPAEPAAAM